MNLLRQLLAVETKVPTHAERIDDFGNWTDALSTTVEFDRMEEGQAFLGDVLVAEWYTADGFGWVTESGNKASPSAAGKKTPWEVLNDLAEKTYGKTGFATLDSSQANTLINMTKADGLAEQRYGEFGFLTCTEAQMRKIVNANPQLLKGQAAKLFKGVVAEADEVEELGEKPKLLAHAGDFRVELDVNEQVRIVDLSGNVKVTMPLVIWKQLCR